jgi:hypothetical protein
LLFPEILTQSQRARAYMMHHTPLDTPVAGPGGNPGAAGFTSYGCPVYSAGEAQVIETMLIEAQPAVLSWMQQVALEGEAYKNAVVEIYGEEEVGQRSSWWGVPEENGNQDNEAETQKDTKGADGEVKDGGEVRINKENDKTEAGSNSSEAKGNNTEASGNNAGANNSSAQVNGNVAQAEGDDGAGVEVIEVGGKAKPVDGPNAQDMKDLVKEIKDLKIAN